jgi:hypothetical protein
MIKINEAKKKEIVSAKAMKDAKEYLSKTDWYVIRNFERGIEIPKDISSERLKAIEKINVLPQKDS